VRSSELEVGNTVVEICASKLDRVDRAQCSDLLQFAYRLQEALGRIAWAVEVFKPVETREEVMNMHGRTVMKLFTGSLSQIETATMAIRMTNIPHKDRITEMIRFIQERGEVNVPNEAATQQKGAYPVKKRVSDKIIKRTNVEGRYSEKTEESEPAFFSQKKSQSRKRASLRSRKTMRAGCMQFTSIAARVGKA
jgi:hypothetical protein